MFWAPLGIIATFVTSTSAQTVWQASSPGYSVPILSINKKTLWYLELDLTDRYVQGGKRRGRRRYWGGKHDEKEGCSHFQWHVHTPPSSSYTQLSSFKDKAKRAKNALHTYDVTCHTMSLTIFSLMWPYIKMYRWFEGRTHGERRQHRRTRTSPAMVPMTPLGRYNLTYQRLVETLT